MHANRQDIGVGGHARLVDRFRSLEVGFRRAHRLLRRLQTFRGEDGPVVRASHIGDRLHLHAALLLAAHVVRQLRGAYRMAGLAGVVQRLIHRHQRLKVVQEIGPVERAKVEVLLSKLMLRKQRPENKDGIVAAGPGLRIVHFR